LEREEGTSIHPGKTNPQDSENEIGNGEVFEEL